MQRMAIAVVGVVLLSCSGSGEQAAPATAEEDAAAEPAETVADPRRKPSQGRPPILVQLGWRNSALGAEVGQRAFAPSRQSLARAVSDDAAERGRVSFGLVEIAALRGGEAQVQRGDDSWWVPNALVLPIEPDEEVTAGDLVLASRHGASMERALVLAADEGRVRANFVQQVPHGSHEAVLEPGTYRRLAQAGVPGTAAAVADGDGGHDLATMLRADGDRALLVGAAGRLVVAARSDVIPVPPHPDVAAGDEVAASRSGLDFEPATIERIDHERGHYWVRFERGSGGGLESVPFGELLPGSR